MEVKPFTSSVGTLAIHGTVSGKYREISDYYVALDIGDSEFKMHFEFEMIMVAIPAMYVVNRLMIDGMRPLVIVAQRKQAAHCFEETLLKIVDLYRDALLNSIVGESSCEAPAAILH